MALQSMTALANVTLQEASASVSFSGIPQNYRDLVLVQSSRVSDYTRLRVNGDSGSNYLMVNMAGNGSSTDSGTVTQTSTYPNYRFNESSSEFMLAVLQFMDYSATDKHKTMLFRANLAGGNVNAIATRWANTAAINNIIVFANSGTISAGSTFNLYGRIA
jgi:hypothetical protein